MRTITINVPDQLADQFEQSLELLARILHAVRDEEGWMSTPTEDAELEALRETLFSGWIARGAPVDYHGLYREAFRDL